jgi:hypothetical protein
VNSSQLFDPAQIDYNLRFPDSILEPVEAVEPSGQHPGIAAMQGEKLLRIGNRSWLQQVERGHYVSDHSHNEPQISFM